MSTKPTEPLDTAGKVSAWIRMLCDAEAKYTATIGSRLKFGLPLSNYVKRCRLTDPFSAYLVALLAEQVKGA